MLLFLKTVRLLIPKENALLVLMGIMFKMVFVLLIMNIVQNMVTLMLRKIGLPNLKLDTEKPVENVIRAITLTPIMNAKSCQIIAKLLILKVSVHNVLVNTN